MQKASFTHRDEEITGAWFSGKIAVSKTADGGSIPSAPAGSRESPRRRFFGRMKYDEFNNEPPNKTANVL